MTYEQVKQIRNNATASDVDNDELSRLIDIAIDKQIGKKIQGGEFAGNCYCGQVVFSTENYCRNCGQRLDWMQKHE